MKIIRLFIVILALQSLQVHAQEQVPNTLTGAQKVYGLSKFWEEVNYNFVYINRIDRKAWDSLYMAMIPAVQQTKNDYEYYRDLQKFCAFLKDGHTDVYFPAAIQKNWVFNTMFGKYRLFIANIDDKAIITNTNPGAKDEIPVGSEIITVDGLSTSQYIKTQVSPYISSSTYYVLKDRAYSSLLQGLKGQTFEVEIKTPAGLTKKLTLTHSQTDEKEIIPAMKSWQLLEFKWYPDQTAYLALNSFGDPKIDSLFVQQLPELYKAKRLIIDLRNNGGGSTDIGVEILKYLTEDTVLYGSKVYTRVHESAFKAWGKWVAPKDTVNNAWNKKSYLDYTDARYTNVGDGFNFKNKITAKKIIVPTAILIGHNTASAAEDFLIYADKQKHFIKIGENSFGSTGQPFNFDLPGGGSARICSKKDTYPDGREFVGYGVKPDIEVKRSYQDYMNNDDPVLNKALAYLKGRSLESAADVKNVGK